MMFSEGMRFKHFFVRQVSCSLTRFRISLNIFSLACYVVVCGWGFMLFFCQLERLKEHVQSFQGERSKTDLFGQTFLTCFLPA